MTAHLSHALSTTRAADARRTAAAARRAAVAVPDVTVRPATSADITAIIELAALDSAPVPAGTILLAEVRGEVQAAIAVESGAVVADPFRRTAAAVRVLRAHAGEARRDARRRRRLSGPRYRRALARGAA